VRSRPGAFQGRITKLNAAELEATVYRYSRQHLKIEPASYLSKECAMHIEMTFYNDDHPNKYNEVFFIACLYNELYLLPEFVSKHSPLFGDDARLDLAIDFTDIDLKDI